MYKNEKQIADKAERMLESALRAKTASYAKHLDRGEKSIGNATASAKLKEYTGDLYFMRTLNIKMPKHGFVLDQGIEAGRVRKSGVRKRNGKEYTYKAHLYKKGMNPKPFIAESIHSSGVVDFVLENISRVRAEEIAVKIKKILEKIN